jgi:hypothetical protein
MKDLVIGLVVLTAIIAAVLVFAPKSPAEVPHPTPAINHRPVSAADRLRVHDQQIKDSMILNSKKDAR